MENQQPSSLAEVISLSPESVAALMRLGYSFYTQGKLKEASDIFDGILLLDSSNPYAYGILGSIQQQQKRFEDAIDYFNRALILYASDINTLTNRGECYLHLGKFEEAAHDLQAAISLDPEENNPAANRARFLTTVTLEALKLAETGGQQAVLDAKHRLDEQLKKPGSGT